MPRLRLPFPDGHLSQCIQGNFETTSHDLNATRYALDFDDQPNTPGRVVVAAASGTAYVRLNDGNWGHTVRIDHGDRYYTVYCHLFVPRVANGAFVSQGAEIGMMGHTGNAFDVHLHFGLHRGDATGTISDSVEAFSIWARDVTVGGQFQWYSSIDFKGGGAGRGHVYEAGTPPQAAKPFWKSLPVPDRWYRSDNRLEYHVEGDAPRTVQELIGGNVTAEHGNSDGYIALSNGPEGWFDYEVRAQNQWNYGVWYRSGPWRGGRDITPPTVKRSAGAQPSIWYRSPTTVTFAASDALAQVRRVRYRWGGAEYSPWEAVSSHEVSLPEDKNALYVEAEDHAFTDSEELGNRAEVNLGEYWLDTKAPVVERPSANPSSSGGILVSLAAADVGTAGSGISEIRFLVNGQDKGGVSGASGQVSWNIAGLAAGSYQLTALARDFAGNESISEPLAYALGQDASGRLAMTARHVSTANNSVAVEITLKNVGEGVASQISLAQLQFGTAFASNAAWTIDGLNPGEETKKTFTFATGFPGKVRLATANVTVAGRQMTLRAMVRKVG